MPKLLHSKNTDMTMQTRGSITGEIEIKLRNQTVSALNQYPGKVMEYAEVAPFQTHRRLQRKILGHADQVTEKGSEGDDLRGQDLHKLISSEESCKSRSRKRGKKEL